mgnify:CR=1 FL=1
MAGMEFSSGSRKTDKTALSIVLALLCILCIKVFMIDFMLAEGCSMTPAIKPGDILLVNKMAYGIKLPGSEQYLLRWNIPKSGDVLVFRTPMENIAVKRCTEMRGTDYFMAVGDNSKASFDSRSYGPIHVDAIIGKVIGIGQ